MNEIITRLANGVLYDFMGFVTSQMDPHMDGAIAVKWITEFAKYKGLTLVEPEWEWKNIVNIKQDYHNKDIIDYGIDFLTIVKTDSVYNNSLIRYMALDFHQLIFNPMCNNINQMNLNMDNIGMGDTAQDAIDDLVWKKLNYFCIFGIDKDAWKC